MGGGYYLSGFTLLPLQFSTQTKAMELIQTLLEVGMLAFLATLTLTLLD